MNSDFTRVVDAFRFFGFDINSPEEEVRKSYRTYMLKHHPDLDSNGHALCVSANEHFDVIKKFWNTGFVNRTETKYTSFCPVKREIDIELSKLQSGFSGSFEFTRHTICRAGCYFDKTCRMCSFEPRLQSKFFDFSLPKGTHPGSSVSFNPDNEWEIPLNPLPSNGWSFSSGRLFLNLVLDMKKALEQGHVEALDISGSPIRITKSELSHMKTKSGFMLANGKVMKARINISSVHFGGV